MYHTPHRCGHVALFSIPWPVAVANGPTNCINGEPPHSPDTYECEIVQGKTEFPLPAAMFGEEIRTHQIHFKAQK